MQTQILAASQAPFLAPVENPSSLFLKLGYAFMRRVSHATFAALAEHHSEREICDIVWLVASEHLFNLSNIGLNIGSDGLCERLAER